MDFPALLSLTMSIHSSMWGYNPTKPPTVKIPFSPPHYGFEHWTLSSAISHMWYHPLLPTQPPFCSTYLLTASVSGSFVRRCVRDLLSLRKILYRLLVSICKIIFFPPIKIVPSLNLAIFSASIVSTESRTRFLTLEFSQNVSRRTSLSAQRYGWLKRTCYTSWEMLNPRLQSEHNLLF